MDGRISVAHHSCFWVFRNADNLETMIIRKTVIKWQLGSKRNGQLQTIFDIAKQSCSKPVNWLVSHLHTVTLHYSVPCLPSVRLFKIWSAAPYGRSAMMSCGLHFKSHTDGPLKPTRRQQSQFYIRKQEPLRTTLPFQTQDTISCSFERFPPLRFCIISALFLKECEDIWRAPQKQNVMVRRVEFARSQVQRFHTKTLPPPADAHCIPNLPTVSSCQLL